MQVREERIVDASFMRCRPVEKGMSESLSKLMASKEITEILIPDLRTKFFVDRCVNKEGVASRSRTENRRLFPSSSVRVFQSSSSVSFADPVEL